MNPSTVLSALLLVAAATGTAAHGAANVADLPCRGTRTETWRDGTVATRCTLERPVEIDGVTYERVVFVDERGAVRHGRLAAPAVVEHAALPAGCWVARDRGGAIEFVFLPRTTTIEGHACRGGGHSYMTRFHPNGRLRTCWMDEDQVVDGVPCRGSGFFLFGGISTEFHENGRLAECTLRRDLAAEDRTVPAGTRVRFDVSGRRLAP